MNERDKARLALIPVLAEMHPARRIGRTALMKYLYFLQVLRKVPLGYGFSMYSYGPFDSNVLSDLSIAESLNLVCSATVSFSGGYGYRISPAAGAEGIKREAREFLERYREDIEWVISEFRELNSAELELASTIVYVDKELEDVGLPDARANLVSLVNDIKPHFGFERIERTVDLLQRKGILASI